MLVLLSAAKLGRRSRKMRDLIRSIEDKQTEQALHGLLSLNSDQESRQLIDSLDTNEVNLNRQEINHLSVAALQMLLKQRAECGPNYPRQRRLCTPPRQDSPLMDGLSHTRHNNAETDQPLDLSDESNPSNNQDAQISALRSSLPLNLMTTSSRVQMMGSILNMQSQLPFHLPHSPLAIKAEDVHPDDRRSPYMSMFDPALTSRSSPSVLTAQSLQQQIAVQQQLAAARHLITQHQLAVTSAGLSHTNLVSSTASGRLHMHRDEERDDEERSEGSESSNTSKSVIVQHTSLDLRKVIKEEESLKHSRSPIKKRPYVPSTSSDRDGDPEVVYKHSRLSADSSSSSRSYSPDRRPPSTDQSPSSSPYPYVPVTSNQLPDYRVTQPLRIETSSHRHSNDESSGPRPLSSPIYSHGNSEFPHTGSGEYRRGKVSGSQSDNHHTAVVAPIIQNQYQLSREDEARLTVPLLTYKIHDSFYTTFTFLKPRLEEMHFKLRSYQGSESMDGIINRLLSGHMDKSNSFQVRDSLFALSGHCTLRGHISLLNILDGVQVVIRNNGN